MTDLTPADMTSEVETSVSKLLFDFLGLEEVIRCVDVGAAFVGTHKDPWLKLAEINCAEVIGFEPLAQECQKLNDAIPSGLIRYLPYAIGDGQDHIFNTTNFSATSSIYEPDRETLNIFRELGNLVEIVDREVIHTKRLDDIPELSCIDFIKMDIQGAELLALENAVKTLENVSVLQCEVEFLEIYKDQPLFADVDTFLRSQGFCFMKFTYIAGRPFKPLAINNNPYQPICQQLWADAVYVKDFRERQHLKERILKSASFILHEFYGGYDLANLFLQELDRRHNTTLSTDYLSLFLGMQVE